MIPSTYVVTPKTCGNKAGQNNPERPRCEPSAATFRVKSYVFSGDCAWSMMNQHSWFGMDQNTKRGVKPIPSFTPRLFLSKIRSGLHIC